MPHNKIAEIIGIAAAVVAFFCAIAIMFWAVSGILDYSLGEASIGRAIVCGCALLIIAVSWVYMRINYWHD